jgi:hypothetical protein
MNSLFDNSLFYALMALIVGGTATPAALNTLFATGSLTFCPNRQCGAIFLQDYLLKCFQILFDVDPHKLEALTDQSVVQFLFVEMIAVFSFAVFSYFFWLCFYTRFRKSFLKLFGIIQTS